MHELMRVLTFLAVVLASCGLAAGVWAQEPDSFAGSNEWAWTPLVEHGGVHFSFIFYREADNHHDGVVIKLVNRNAFAVAYAFKVVFQAADGSDHVEPVSGHLEAGQGKTGDQDGLFWIPFKDGRSIAAVGLRGYKVTRVAGS